MELNEEGEFTLKIALQEENKKHLKGETTLNSKYMTRKFGYTVYVIIRRHDMLV